MCLRKATERIIEVTVHLAYVHSALLSSRCFVIVIPSEVLRRQHRLSPFFFNSEDTLLSKSGGQTFLFRTRFRIGIALLSEHTRLDCDYHMRESGAAKAEEADESDLSFNDIATSRNSCFSAAGDCNFVARLRPSSFKPVYSNSLYRSTVGSRKAFH